MTKILINRISYKYFKGISDFTLSLNGAGAKILGCNASGKTSLADGFRWLLFGKNLSDEKLNPKPLDNNNQEQLGLNPEVEAELLIDGRLMTLKRVQEERWVKKNGEIEKTRNSDTTKYYIDEVPTKEKDWKEFISKIADENLFFILSNPGSFMQMPWKNRREMLVDLSGMTDEEVIKSNPDLLELSSILENHSVDDMKKILAGQKKNIKQQVEGIPGRIQENKDAIDRLTLEDKDLDELKKKFSELEKDVASKEEKLLITKQGDSSLDYQEQISKLNIKLSESKMDFLATANLNTQNLQNEVMELQRKVGDLKNQETLASNNIYNSEQLIKRTESELLDLRAEYSKLNATTFDDHQKDCPTCGQELPSDQVSDLMDKFNLDKSSRLEKNIAEGKSKKSQLESEQLKLAELKNNHQQIVSALADKNKGLELLQEEYTHQKSQQGTFEESDSYKKIQQSISDLQEKVLTARADSSQAIQEAQYEYDQAVNSKAEIQSQIQMFQQAIPFEERITQLRQQDSDLKNQNQEVERKLYLIDEFIRMKVKMLEENINSKFEMVQFKLFDLQKNGALNEVCEATYQGIEYGASLNNGAKINCDIDIVNTLSKAHDLFLPLFVDNAEAVNQLIPSDSQMIELRVSEDKQLKVEV